MNLSKTTVTQLSGPVNLVYLKPGPLFFGLPQAHQPLVMLFGDLHRDSTGLCDCKTDGCHAIYDPAFLKELDTLGAAYPIDFYTESALEFPYAKATPEDILFYQFHRRTRACHNRALRTKNLYSHRCPTEHIRWHYADPRFMMNTTEYHLFGPVADHWIGAFPDGMKPVLAHWKATADPRLTDLAAVHDWFYKLKLRSEQALPTPGFEQRYHDSRAVFHPDALRPIRHQMMRVLLHSRSALPHKFHHLFAPYVDGPAPSLVLKQLAKIPIRLSRDQVISFLAQTFEAAMNAPPPPTVYQRTALEDMERFVDTLPPPLAGYIDFFFEVTPAQFHAEGPAQLEVLEQQYGPQTPVLVWKAFNVALRYAFDLHAYFADIYMLLRMMKPPHQSTLPYLAFGFFGSDHVRRMANILTATPFFGYQEAYRIEETDPVSRCLTFLQPLDLAGDLQRHATAILEQNQRARHTLPLFQKQQATERYEREADRLRAIQWGGTTRPPHTPLLYTARGRRTRPHLRTARRSTRKRARKSRRRLYTMRTK
jgi:hypothetical protein